MQILCHAAKYCMAVGEIYWEKTLMLNYDRSSAPEGLPLIIPDLRFTRKKRTTFSGSFLNIKNAIWNMISQFFKSDYLTRMRVFKNTSYSKKINVFKPKKNQLLN